MALSLHFGVERLGVIMRPDPGLTSEVEGVLNPGGVTGPDGEYYLLPRCVGAGNYSRIGLARVCRDGRGRPSGVERLGVVLQPAASYELVGSGVGGCEDPRITYLMCADLYVMAYTAYGRGGPHVAMATSRDLRVWTRHGLADFACEQQIDFNRYFNKDAMLLPEPVRAPDGAWALALLHRPLYEMWDGCAGVRAVPAPLPPHVADDRPSIWISYSPLDTVDWLTSGAPLRFGQHTVLATPEGAWEGYRIGGGAVPVRTAAGWLMFYHGVERCGDGRRCYRVGAVLLDREVPHRVLARSQEPIFGPETADERAGVVNDVVFPTAVEERAGGFDVYYGMADSRIGVAHLTRREVGAAAQAA